MDRHGQVKDADEDASRREWKEDVKIAEEYTEYRQNFITMLEKFETMWDGHLGRIDVAKQRIELKPCNQRPIHLTPYRAGPKARYFEKHEVERMLAEK